MFFCVLQWFSVLVLRSLLFNTSDLDHQCDRLWQSHTHTHTPEKHTQTHESHLGHTDAVLAQVCVRAVVWGTGSWSRSAATCRIYRPAEEEKDRGVCLCENTQVSVSASMSASLTSPVVSRERFLSVLMGLSLRRSNGLLLRSDTFCFSRERSFRFGSDAAKTTGNCLHKRPHRVHASFRTRERSVSITEQTQTFEYRATSHLMTSVNTFHSQLHIRHWWNSICPAWTAVSYYSTSSPQKGSDHDVWHSLSWEGDQQFAVSACDRRHSPPCSRFIAVGQSERKGCAVDSFGVTGNDAHGSDGLWNTGGSQRTAFH